MLPKTVDALTRINGDALQAMDPLIKQLITQHLIVLAVAETEDALEKIIVDHFHATSTPPAKNLAESCLSSLLRSIKTSEVAGFLRRLGEPYKNRFQAEMKNIEADESKYNNLIVNRHSVVHEAQCNITYEEFLVSVPSIQKVCEALQRSLAAA